MAKSKVLLAAYTGALGGLLLGAVASANLDSVQVILERESRCYDTYAKDAYFGAARSLCASDLWPFRLTATKSTK